MASSPRQPRKSRLLRPSRNQPIVPEYIPWRLMIFTAIVYAAAGTVMASFPGPYWIWNLAIGGAIAQASALAGPIALSRFTWWKANALVLLALLGTSALAVALGIALGFVGTDNLDEIELMATAFEVIRVGLLAMVIAALGAVLSAETGDRLLYTFNRLQTTLVLAATCILGLGLGGFMGLLIGD